MKSTIKDVDSYIKQFDEKKQMLLQELRKLILDTVPEAEEKIAWGAPTYYLNGYLIQFAVCAHHLGFYCTPTAIDHYKEELKGIPCNNKNTVQLAYDKPLPEEIIRKLILFRVEENNLKMQDSQK